MCSALVKHWISKLILMMGAKAQFVKCNQNQNPTVVWELNVKHDNSLSFNPGYKQYQHSSSNNKKLIVCFPFFLKYIILCYWNPGVPFSQSKFQLELIFSYIYNFINRKAPSV